VSDQQTEKATPQRKKKARESGDWVRSRELLSGAAMLAGLMTLGMAGSSFVASWRQCYARCVVLAVSGTARSWGIRELVTALRVGLLPAVGPTAMVMAACLCAVVGVGFGQGGGVNFSVKALQPKLSRLNPGSHVKQMFSMRTVARTAKSVIPAAAGDIRRGLWAGREGGVGDGGVVGDRLCGGVCELVEAADDVEAGDEG